jgi:hypothetical protein
VGRSAAWGRLAQRIDARIGWHRLPAPLALLVLLGLQRALTEPAAAGARPDAQPELLEPNPRAISRALLGRERFAPAPGLNVHTAAWLEWMARGWFSRGPNSRERPWRVPRAPDESGPEFLEFERAHREPGYGIAQPSWWDDAPLYGASAQERAALRSGEGGRLRLDTAGRIALPSGALEQPGVWLGLALFAQLFGLEHNAICARLRAAQPQWSDERLFECARRVIGGLLAKIHAAEWLPAVSGSGALRLAARAGVWGPRGPLRRRFARRAQALRRVLGRPELPRGSGSGALAEEDFAAAARLHPLLPDEFALRRARDGTRLACRSLGELSGSALRGVLEAYALGDLHYSLGSAPAGALALHGFPRGLQDYAHPGGAPLDLAALDVLRARELGAVRYNELRRRLGRPALARFAELSREPQWVEELRSAYRNELEQVDLLVGLCAEPPPRGFALSESAFRVLLALSAQRFASDPFLAHGYSAEHYSEPGLEWIDRGSLRAVLLRHHPQLRAALPVGRSAFAIWGEAD